MGALCISIGDVKRDDDDGLVFEVGFYHEDVFFLCLTSLLSLTLCLLSFPIYALSPSFTLFLLLSRSFSHALSPPPSKNGCITLQIAVLTHHFLLQCPILSGRETGHFTLLFQSIFTWSRSHKPSYLKCWSRISIGFLIIVNKITWTGDEDTHDPRSELLLWDTMNTCSGIYGEVMWRQGFHELSELFRVAPNCQR